MEFPLLNIGDIKMVNYTKKPRTCKTTVNEIGSFVSASQTISVNPFILVPNSGLPNESASWELNDIVITRWAISIFSDDEPLAVDELGSVSVYIEDKNKVHSQQIVNNLENCYGTLPITIFEGVFKNITTYFGGTWALQLNDGTFDDKQTRITVVLKPKFGKMPKYKLTQVTNYLTSIEDSKFVVKV